MCREFFESSYINSFREKVNNDKWRVLCFLSSVKIVVGRFRKDTIAVILRLFLSRLWDYRKHLVGPGYPFKNTYDHVARALFIVIIQKNIALCQSPR